MGKQRERSQPTVGVTPGAENKNRELVRRQTLGVLKQLANVFIALDIPSGEFISLARHAFVDAARRESMRPSGTINRSRIAAITGLTRPEITRLLRESGRQLATARHASRAERVMQAWASDPRFKTRSGAPRQLSLEDLSTGGFASLIQCAACDIPPRAMLKRLVTLGYVSVVNGKHATAIRFHRKSAPSSESALSAVRVSAALTSLVGLVSEDRPVPTIETARLLLPDLAMFAATAKDLRSRTSVFLEGIRSIARPGNGRRNKHQIEIVVGISAAKTKPLRKAQRTDQSRTQQRLTNAKEK